MGITTLQRCQPHPRPHHITAHDLRTAQNKLLYAVMIDVFAPTIASRIYLAPSVAAYQVLALQDTSLISLTQVISHFPTLPPLPKDIDATLASLLVYEKVATKLVSSEYIMKDLEDSLLAALQLPPTQQNLALAYADSATKIIIAWVKKDNYLPLRSATKYVISDTLGAWQPTTPDYAQASEPHWDLMRTMLLDPTAMPTTPPPTPYSQHPKDDYRKEMQDLYLSTQKLDSTQAATAYYWDDNPSASNHEGHMTYFLHKISPAGHWLNIAATLTTQQHNNYTQTAQTLAYTSIALYDAFIACWHAKYTYNTQRPITYINQLIDPRWQPLIQTPPFPEYPSGHSTISAAAATILTQLYGDDIAFTDSTQTPFAIPPRKFTTIQAAADQASQSRVFAGIHLPKATEAGAQLGKNVGQLTIKKLTIKKLTIKKLKQH